MSLVVSNILSDIKLCTDKIESMVYALQSLDSGKTEKSTINHTFSIKSLYSQTRNIHQWVIDNGGCSGYTDYNGDIITKWSCLIEDLHWTIFGSNIPRLWQEKNKLHIIYFKLQYIQKNLEQLVPKPTC